MIHNNFCFAHGHMERKRSNSISHDLWTTDFLWVEPEAGSGHVRMEIQKGKHFYTIIKNKTSKKHYKKKQAFEKGWRG